jgi:hypothetical protein
MRKQIFVADIPNENGRTFPFRLLNQIKDQITSMSNKGLSLGELDHPDNSIINLAKISHKFSNPKIETNTEAQKALFVDVEILPTPSGKILEQFIDFVEFKPRALGTLEDDGTVNDDYELISIDAVLKIK